MISHGHVLTTDYRIRIEAKSGAEVATAILAEGLGRDGYRCAVRLPETGSQRLAEGHREVAILHVARGTGKGETQPGTDMVIVLDEELLAEPETLQGLGSGGVLLVNSERTPLEWRQLLAGWDGTIATVGAERIAGNEGTDVAVPMLGAAARVSGITDAETLCATVWAAYDRDLPYAARAACQGFETGYNQVQY